MGRLTSQVRNCCCTRLQGVLDPALTSILFLALYNPLTYRDWGICQKYRPVGAEHLDNLPPTNNVGFHQLLDKMTAPGVVYKDLLPIPDDTQAVSESDNRDGFHFTRQEPSASHALAQATPEVRGIAQQDHGSKEVRDLGWNEPKEHIPAPLVGGMQNEELWMLVRRFNKVDPIYDIHGYSH